MSLPCLEVFCCRICGQEMTRDEIGRVGVLENSKVVYSCDKSQCLDALVETHVLLITKDDRDLLRDYQLTME